MGVFSPKFGIFGHFFRQEENLLTIFRQPKIWGGGNCPQSPCHDATGVLTFYLVDGTKVVVTILHIVSHLMFISFLPL